MYHCPYYWSFILDLDKYHHFHYKGFFLSLKTYILYNWQHCQFSFIIYATLVNMRQLVKEILTTLFFNKYKRLNQEEASYVHFKAIII